MGRREKKVKSLENSSSEEDKKRKRRSVIEAADSDDDANEDLSLKIVQKSMQRAAEIDPRDDGVSEVVTDLKEEKRKKKEKRRRKKNKEIEAPVDSVSDEIDAGFRDFCGDLVDNTKDEDKKPEADNAPEVSVEAVETNPAEVSVVMRKLLRGPRYFDPPDSSWGACYNCGEEGHTSANCTSARRKKPCFVCGSFEHNAKQCSKGRDCFICKQQGHRAKDCPEKYKSSKICLRCGDLGHEMFSCRNEYCPDDIKEIQCYICGKFGHLCCINYGDPDPMEASCYRCGLSGHTGLACMGWSRGDTNDTVYANSCYKCGIEGHFARECTSSVKAGKRHREPSTPKHRSFKKNKNHMEPCSAPPHDLGKSWKKNKSQYGEYASAPKSKTKHGWYTEHPGDYYSNETEANNWRSGNSSHRRDKFGSNYASKSNYASSSNSYKKPRKLNFNNSPSNGSTPRFYQHDYSASRFSYYNGNDSRGRYNDYR